MPCLFKPVRWLMAGTALLVFGLVACKAELPTATSTPDPSIPTAKPYPPEPTYPPSPTPNLPSTAGWIAFVSRIDGKDHPNVYLANADTGELLRLTDAGNGGGFYPAWLPDGRQIAFTANQNIYVMYSDGSNPHPITNFNEDMYGVSMPKWSPGGKQIVFWTDYTSNPGDSYINVVNIDGTHQKEWLSGVANAGWEAMVWSPDSQEIVFMTRGVEHSATVLRIINRDFSQVRSLTDYAVDCYESVPCPLDVDPTWSPDGRQIAFVCVDHQFEGQTDICIINSDGSQLTNLTDNSASETDITWSPDGQQLAFSSVEPRDLRGGIYVMDADGSNRMQLTYYSASDRNPVWSPDGKRIAFVSERDGNKEIYLMNADGSDQRRLTNNKVEDSYPAWSPQLGSPGDK